VKGGSKQTAMSASWDQVKGVRRAVW
jgi:hypothetical protein